MHRSMDTPQIGPGTNYTGPAMLVIMWINTMITIFEKANFTFIVSTIVSALAGYYYWLQIKKIRKENKNPK